MIDVVAIIARWSDARLALEIDQATACADDPRQTQEFRESALAAGVLMCQEFLKRKAEREGR